SRASVDRAFIAYAGGQSRIEGSSDRFNAVEIHQADVRITNSTLQNNADGAAVGNRNGRGTNLGASIFVRGAQPVIVNNVLRDNMGDSISVNANAMLARTASDVGRATGGVELFEQFADNLGPLVRLNRLGGNAINGMSIRGATLTAQTAWDDTDIVHVLRDEIISPDFHTFGGIRLQSSATDSLVVKLRGVDAGITASGRPLDINDRIGGTVQVVGTPNHPVVMTSLDDFTVGAGLTPDGDPQTDTLNTGLNAGLVSQIFAPMIDQFTDTVPNIDEWFMIADASGTISVDVYDEDGGLLSIDGAAGTVAVPQSFTTVSASGLVPGSLHVFTHTLGAGLSLTHY
ncbi:MAG: hypothetical protein WD176_03605, partial [Pirellulales bacterium]